MNIAAIAPQPEMKKLSSNDLKKKGNGLQKRQ